MSNKVPIGERVMLTLPLPSAPNRSARDKKVDHFRKRAYQRSMWIAAVSRVMPRRDPPAKVRVDCFWYVHNRRDEDNLAASLKWVLDGLKQVQKGNLGWRNMLYERCGFFVDDDPDRLMIGNFRDQKIDRKNPRLILLLTPIAGP